MLKVRNYIIADVSLNIKGDKTVELLSILKGFEVFRVESCDNPEINIISDANNLRDEYTNVVELCRFNADSTEHIFSESDRYYYFELIDGDGISHLLKHEKGSNLVQFETCENLFMLRFLMWVAYSLVALKFGVVPIHASSVVHNNQGVLFLGESGTGKSTHTQLWLKNIKDTTHLNDDSPLLRMVNGELMIYGSPWSGKVDCYKKEVYSVKSLVRIKQGSVNDIVKHGTLVAIGAVYPSCPPMYVHSEPLADMILDMVSNIVKSVPIYTLTCLPNAEAALTSYSELYGK